RPCQHEPYGPTSIRYRRLERSHETHHIHVVPARPHLEYHVVTSQDRFLASRSHCHRKWDHLAWHTTISNTFRSQADAQLIDRRIPLPLAPSTPQTAAPVPPNRLAARFRGHPSRESPRLLSPPSAATITSPGSSAPDCAVPRFATAEPD